MRADMGKVLVERPRLRNHSGNSEAGKGYRKQLRKSLDAVDSPPRREGMKVRYGHRRKFFNENLAPLRRFLQSNVGRPWDKVYAEICEHIDHGNVVQKHILTHLFDYVVTRTVLIDGEPCRGEGYYGGRRYGEPLRTTHNRHQWYVCPKSGLLRRSRCVPWGGERPEPPRVVRLNNKQACVCRGGRWELISVGMVSQFSPQAAPDYELILKRHIDSAAGPGSATESHAGNRYAVTRRPLSRKELLALPIPVEWLR